MKITLPEEGAYGPVGHCIYCEASQLPLSREHIIAKGLGGRLVLRGASCEICAKETSRLERFFLRKMLRDPRVHLGITSHPKEQPNLLTVGRYDAPPDNSLPPDMGEANFQWEEMEVAMHPYVLMLPIFATPTLLSGKKPTENFEITGFNIHANSETNARLQSLGQGKAVFQPFSPDVICRVLAKIGHSAAVGAFGYSQFEPYLPDVILARKQYSSHFVGRSAARPRSKGALHRIQFLIRNGHLVCRIQLFASLSFMPYDVVVGLPTGQLARRMVGIQL